MKRILAALLVLLPTVALAQSAPLIVKQGRITQPGTADTLVVNPAYPGLNSSLKGTSVNVGGCLATDYLAGATGNFTSHAIVGCMVQPSGAYSGTATWPDAAVAGSIVSSNADHKSAVGIYGSAATTTSGSGIYGGNFTAVNCRAWSAGCTHGAGFDFTVMYGIEADVNVYSKAGTVAPTGAVKGVIAQFNGDLTPATSAQAFDLQATGGGIWTSGYTSEAGATSVGMFLNSVSASNASGNSQSIQLVSRGGGGTPTITTIQAITGGAVTVSQPVVLPNYTVSTLPSCSTALKGALAYVTDATAPAYNGALTGSGTVGVPVACNGTSWSSH